MVKLDLLPTEQRNADSAHIDTLSTEDMVRLINREDQKVALAVQREMVHITAAVDLIYEKLCGGGRLIYCGAGTSGRLGVLDAAECVPTYATPPDLVQGVIAGGREAMFRAVEGAEDNGILGAADLRGVNFSASDVLVGVAASGRTPYVLGAIAYAKSLGAAVVAVTCCPGSAVDRAADVGIAPTPGPEVVTGSTRMKSGTAQKMVLNMLSTCAMIRMGKVYGNLMVDVVPSNDKLMCRCISIVRSATGCAEDEAQAALDACGHSAKVAIVMVLCACTAKEARTMLDGAEGRISAVLAQPGGNRP